ncbi:ribosome biogenesis factor YjgA [Marinibactrum halimedae]|uniref:Dual-action ribosomal maturation protein DarP n=1 Tax=Marinibactrum halimedae TaxID=1444977 RepID=A0AA37WL43_9GAMM|nr:ribosome biogenesis factor YjgA [Marinibactrum halimedae]MCD9457518.1 DUF615 domain-containing protein [Marinibactrum halimedae]GLS25428.1 UPF0307 protein [Marinibactrum halimedae]
MIDDNPHDDEELFISKTAVKKEMKGLQDLGSELTELSDNHLATVPLSTNLQEAIALARKLKAGSARKRQVQYIAKLLRNDDFESIKAALDAIKDRSRLQTKSLHVAEQWRDRLLQEPSTSALFLEEYPTANRQLLNQLIRAANKEATANKPPASARKLFKLIREVVDNTAQP